MYRRDTIAAISTPIGEGGIGIIRISGGDSQAIAERIFRKKGSGGLESHRFYYGEIRDPENGEIIDEGLTVLMRSPRSYTREDVLEIQCHGGYLVLQKVLELVLRQNARLAEPGEFTKRAFLNGRIDLLQAEAVIEVIRGKTDAALAMAQHQREGILSARMEEIRTDIITPLAYVEAHLDFPEEDIDVPGQREIAESVRKSFERIEVLLDGFREGKVLREGVTVMIAGKPNVGKSSLLNNLLQEKRAIVTSIPGTTRDIIEEVVNIRGLPVRLLDTAGIRETEDEIEREGMRLTLEKISQADLVLFLLDASRPLEDEDFMIRKSVSGKPVILVRNKTDLVCNSGMPEGFQENQCVDISALTGAGVDNLKEAIFSKFIRRGALDSREFTALSQMRHRDALERAKRSLKSFLENVMGGVGLELLAIDLREALTALGEITGETTPDEILDQIFQRFCIGK